MRVERYRISFLGLGLIPRLARCCSSILESEILDSKATPLRFSKGATTETVTAHLSADRVGLDFFKKNLTLHALQADDYQTQSPPDDSYMILLGF